MVAMPVLVVWGKDLEIEDKDKVGSELASLSELSKNHVKILQSIIITPNAFLTFQEENNLTIQIKHLLGTINFERHDSTTQVAAFIQRIINHSEISRSIYEPLFKYYEKPDAKSVSLTALYFRDNRQIAESSWDGIAGESTLIEKVREAWAQLFTSANLRKHAIHHENHSLFTVCLVVKPEVSFEFTGHIKTLGKNKGEFEIEAHQKVKYVYNKHTGKIEQGIILDSNHKNILSIKDIKTLLSYAHSAEKILYFPSVLLWGKLDGELLVTGVKPVSDLIEYDSTFKALSKNITVHPGITIGRLKVVDNPNKTVSITNEEIIMLKSLNKDMIASIKKARGIILEENPDPEVSHMLKGFGIPTVIRSKTSNSFYATGEIISLNAATGEIKRGSMLVS